MNILKKLFIAFVSFALASGALVGCSQGSDSGITASEASKSSTAGFPVTIKHRYGETVIEKEPKRVASVGYTDQDPLLALGVTPVSVLYWDGMTPDGQAAGVWSNDLITGKQPRIQKGGQPDPEAIASDKPDLIVAVYSDIDEQMYKKLSKIAPVVVQSGDYKPLQQPWDISTMQIGKALGKEDQAKELVNEVKQKFADIKMAHPEWKDKTMGVVTTEEDKVYIFSSEDPRSRFFVELGFTINPKFDEICGDKFYGEVSKENVKEIDSDLIVWDQLSYSPKKDETSVTDDPILNLLSAVKDKHSVYLTGDLEKAFGWQTVASLKYVLDNIEKPLAEAAK